jgi:ABC-type nitrate/sulfonate/bicarbonate transport system ATPase subunit
MQETPTRTNGAPTLEVDAVSHRFGELEVVRDVSLTIESGRVVSMLGPSGCGKSTLLHICAGLTAPAAGRLVLRGSDITGTTGHLSYLQQKDLLLPWLRIEDNVALPLELRGWNRRDARDEARRHFAQFGIAGFERHFPAQLSGGMRQRAALLRTYLFSHDVMLLDEPFGALDTITRGRMHEWLLSLLRTIETSVLLVTHDVDEALLLSDEIVVLSSRPARIVETIPVTLARPRSEATLLSEPFLALKTAVLSALHRGESEAGTVDRTR